jgi:hypothetical protein
VARIKREPKPNPTPRKIRPALTPEAREKQLTALAYDLAEQRLLDGTASSQEVVHFLKLASKKYRTEVEILDRQKDLITAKTEQLQSQKRVEELYANAISAMKEYSGHGSQDDEYEDY